MAIEIRTARSEDRDVLVRFNEAIALETENKTLDRGRLEAGVEAALADPNKGFYVVATIDNQTVGGLLITTEWSDWRNGTFWWIQSVFVAPEHRRGGVYTHLHRWVEDAARSKGGVCGIRLYVDRGNARAMATYERLGMTRSRYNLYEFDLDGTP